MLLNLRQESERQLVEELQNNISLLEREKREKAVDRLRYEKEIEQLEENWKKETQELLGKISRVQEENKRLSSSLKESTEKNVSKSKLFFSMFLIKQVFVIFFYIIVFLDPIPKEPDWDLFEKLREANEKQRDLLRCRDKEYQDKLSESESVNLLINFRNSLFDVTDLNLLATKSSGSINRTQQRIAEKTNSYVSANENFG